MQMQRDVSMKSTAYQQVSSLVMALKSGYRVADLNAMLALLEAR